eukprot:5762363-Prymnesium_polylepis.1
MRGLSAGGGWRVRGLGAAASSVLGPIAARHERVQSTAVAVDLVDGIPVAQRVDPRAPRARRQPYVKLCALEVRAVAATCGAAHASAVVAQRAHTATNLEWRRNAGQGEGCAPGEGLVGCCACACARGPSLKDVRCGDVTRCGSAARAAAFQSPVGVWRRTLRSRPARRAWPGPTRTARPPWVARQRAASRCSPPPCSRTGSPGRSRPSRRDRLLSRTTRSACSARCDRDGFGLCRARGIRRVRDPSARGGVTRRMRAART